MGKSSHVGVVLLSALFTLCHAAVLFQEDFEGTSGTTWEFQAPVWDSANFDPNFQTSDAHSGSGVGQFVVNGTTGAGTDKWAMVFPETLEMARPAVLFTSYYLRFSEDCPVGTRGVVGTYMGGDFPQQNDFDGMRFGLQDGYATVEWDAPEVGPFVLARTERNARANWVLVEQLFVSDENLGWFNYTGEAGIDGLGANYGAGRSLDGGPLGEMLRQTFGVYLNEPAGTCEMWIDDLVVYDTLVSPGAGSWESVTHDVEDWEVREPERVYLEDVTWPTHAGSPWGLDVGVMRGGKEVEGLDVQVVGDLDVMETGMVDRIEVAPSEGSPYGNLCEAGLKYLTIVWKTRDNYGLLPVTVEYSEEVPIVTPESWCNPQKPKNMNGVIIALAIVGVSGAAGAFFGLRYRRNKLKEAGGSSEAEYKPIPE